MKSNFKMDADLAARFISTLTKSLQAVLHGCLDCDKDIELGGYVYLRIDNSQRVDYVLSEKMQKSDVNSMTFHSNSFHALPQSTSSAVNKQDESNKTDASSAKFDKPPTRNSDDRLRPVTENVNRAHSHPYNTGASSLASIGRRYSDDSLAQPGASLARVNDRTQPLTDFQAAFKSPSHLYSGQHKQSPAGIPQALSQNGSSTSRQLSGSSQLNQRQEQQQSKSSILPNASEMEVVHIKTEDEDDVFSIPFACQQAGSSADGLGAQDKWMAMRARHPTFYSPYPRLSRSHSWDHRMSSSNEGFRFPTSGDSSGDSGENLSCKECGKTYRSRQGLIFHERAKHQNLYNVYCPVCGKGFQQTTHMYGHMATHTNVKNFGCQACGARYAHKTSLQQHIRSGACRGQQSQSSSSFGSTSPSATSGLDLSNAQLLKEFSSYGHPSDSSSNQSHNDPLSPLGAEFPIISQHLAQSGFGQHRQPSSLSHADLRNPECSNMQSFSHEGSRDEPPNRSAAVDLTETFSQSSGLDLTVEEKNEGHTSDSERDHDTNCGSETGGDGLYGMNLTLDHSSQSEVSRPTSGSSLTAQTSDEVHSGHPADFLTDVARSQMSRPPESSQMDFGDLSDDRHRSSEMIRPSDMERHTPDEDSSHNYSQDSDDPPATVSLSLSADDD